MRLSERKTSDNMCLNVGRPRQPLKPGYPKTESREQAGQLHPAGWEEGCQAGEGPRPSPRPGPRRAASRCHAPTTVGTTEHRHVVRGLPTTAGVFIHPLTRSGLRGSPPPPGVDRAIA